MNNHETYMHRCIQLARMGAGYVAPNPMVGAVLVHEGRIIGEGFHEKYGHPHAEVNCIGSVPDAFKPLIEQAVLYVSLEPCTHFGKTPPCTDLIIENKIPRVVIGCLDVFDKVNGKGVAKLTASGVDVTVGVLEKECHDLNRRFFGVLQKKRPYVILKWSQSKDGKLSNPDRSKVSISNEFTNRLVHRWRAEEASILVGKNTALLDNPTLNVRLWKGPDPLRLVIDRSLSLPDGLTLFDRRLNTIVFNNLLEKSGENLHYYKMQDADSTLRQVMQRLYQLEIQSVLVEGGPTLLQAFIDEKIWDEARIITNLDLHLGRGMESPALHDAVFCKREMIGQDLLEYFRFSG